MNQAPASVFISLKKATSSVPKTDPTMQTALLQLSLLGQAVALLTEPVRGGNATGLVVEPFGIFLVRRAGKRKEHRFLDF